MSITLCVWKDQRGSEKSISSKRHSLEPNRFWKTAFWNCCCWSRSEQQKQKIKLRRLWLWRQVQALENSLEFDLTKKVRENEKESLSLFFLPFFSFLVFVSRENQIGNRIGQGSYRNQREEFTRGGIPFPARGKRTREGRYFRYGSDSMGYSIKSGLARFIKKCRKKIANDFLY